MRSLFITQQREPCKQLKTVIFHEKVVSGEQATQPAKHSLVSTKIVFTQLQRPDKKTIFNEMEIQQSESKANGFNGARAHVPWWCVSMVSCMTYLCL